MTTAIPTTATAIATVSRTITRTKRNQVTGRLKKFSDGLSFMANERL